MSSLLMSSHGMALATAAAMALSGTAILVSLCRQRSLPSDPQLSRRRPCITSAEKRENDWKKAKRVRFGEDVVVEFDDHADGDGSSNDEEGEGEDDEVENAQGVHGCDPIREVPANQAALYRGLLRDRSQRMARYR